MKNLFKQKFALLAVASVFVLASCNKKNDPSAGVKPTVKVTAKKGSGDALTSGGSVEAGDSIMFNVDVTTPGLFKVLFVQDSASKKQVAKIDKNTKLNGKEIGGGKKSLNVSIKVKTNADMVGKSQTLLFFAQDSVSQNSEKMKFKFSVAAPASPDAKKMTGKLLYVPLNEANGRSTAKSFFSIAKGTSYSNKQIITSTEKISETIDLGYYYGSSNNATLAAPSAYDAGGISINKQGEWKTRNATKMAEIVIENENYAKIKTVADVEAQVKKATLEDGAKIKNLKAGTVIAFETVSTPVVKGLIKVLKVKGTFDQGDYIELEFITNMDGTAK